MAERSAFVFPGAGVELSGPSADEAVVFARHEAVMGPLLAQASLFLKTNLAAGLKGPRALGPLEQQAFTYAYGLGIAAVLEGFGASPAAVAGHSLGAYAAVVAAGGLSFDEGLDALVAAFGCARSASFAGDYGLAGVVGLDAADLDSWAARSPSLRRVITNNAVSHVIAGERAALESLLARALREGARTHWLDRAVPYHHPVLLAAAAAPFRAALTRLAFREAARPVVSTLSDERAHRHELLVAPEALRSYVAQNLVTPIAWDGVVRAFVDSGVEVVFECGPGTTLSRVGRLVEADLRHMTVRDLARRGR